MPDTAHYSMRRSEKAVTDPKELQRIIQSAQVCRLALADHDTPYIVPMHFGMKDNTLYFHCAQQGRKLDIISRNPVVCFEIESDHHIINTGKPCDWSTRYTSIIGYGTASLITDLKQKREALNIIVAHYAPSTVYEFEEKKVDEVAVLKVAITSMTGKKSGPPAWHIPAENEWNTLFSFYTSNGFAGSPLKFTGYSGFNALLDGVRFKNSSWNFNSFATLLWSSSSHGPYKAWAHGMNTYNPSVSFYPASRSNAFSVRCIKD